MEQQQQSEADLALEKVEELQSALDDEKRKKEACEQQIQQQLQVCEVPPLIYLFSLVKNFNVDPLFHLSLQNIYSTRKRFL